MDPTALSDALLAWYDAHRRALPWREDPQPYKVLLSELMLQQTRVDTVLPYFDRFLARWPTLEALAAADDAEVLREWAGLGYYRRARHLLGAARQAVARGGLPGDVQGLRALPGIGPYTAGAIASIGFGVRAPLVDGNVERVLSRLDARDADPRGTEGRMALWARAGELVPEQRPGDFNQALMELGALVCTPKRPACDACPWRSACQGRSDAERFPVKPARKAARAMRGVAVVLWRGEAILLGRRPHGGLLGGLWEPPWVEAEHPEAGATLVASLGLRSVPTERAGEVVHVFTHQRLTLTVLAGDGSGEPRGTEAYPEAAWVQGEGVALSKLARKVIAAARDDREARWRAPTLFAASPER